MALVMGTFKAQAILQSVWDDSKLNSGVYATVRSPPLKRKKGDLPRCQIALEAGLWVKLGYFNRMQEMKWSGL